MAFIIKDRVRESTTTTGTSAISLGGTSTSFQTFSSNMSNGDTTHYAIVHQAADEWEVGVGTWNTGNTLTRTTVLSSSNSNAAVSFTSGTKDVFMTYPATKSINKDTGKADIDALGINATQVSGFTVGKSVPSNAVFTDTNTTYSVGDGGLTQNNFTNADHSKLDGIAASANNYTHPNHSGEVTSSGDGATVIASNVVDADNLKVTGNGSNTQFLRSDGDGTFTWATPVDTNTTYSIGDGGLTTNDFTNADHSKLNAIEAGATAYTNANAVSAVTASDLDMGGNKVLFGNMYSALSDLPSASTYHGMFAHVHSTNKAYYAHNGSWVPLANASDIVTYTVQDGQLSQNNFTNADHSKLDGIASSANNYTHPNHSGEVTSTADGATVIADNVVDEANLKVSNTPTDGYMLTAQSGNAGGLTWAAAASGGGGASSINGLSDGFADSNSNLGLGDNSAFGNISTAYRNIALGWNTAGSITTGDDNVLLGRNVSAFLTTGTGNTAVGSSALPGNNLDKMTGNYNTAVGQSSANSIRAGDSGTFIGHNSNGASNADFQTAIGYNAVTSAAGATALTNSRASGADSFAASITTNSTTYGAKGANGISIGKQAVTTTSSDGISIGQLSSSGNKSIALGYGTASTGSQSVAIGNGSSTGVHFGSTAIGNGVTASTSNEVSIGSSSQGVRISETYTLPKVDGTANGQVLTTNGSGAVSWATPASGGGGSPDLFAENYDGTSTKPSATGANAIALGYDSVASGSKSLVLLQNGTASGNRALSAGFGSTASGTNSVAFGSGAVASGNYSYALGSSTDSTHSYSVAMGYSSQALADYSIALGRSHVSGEEGFAAQIGTNTSSYGASGANSIAMGYASKSTGMGSVSVGTQNTSSSTYSTSIGYLNTASGQYSTALGREALSATQSKFAYASGKFSSVGDAQSGMYVLRTATTDATATAISVDGSSINSANGLNIPNDSVYGFTGTVIAREDSSATNDFAVWEIKGGVVRAASANTTALGSYNINKISESTGASNWDIALSTNTTHGQLAITVTGEASHNIRWVATVNTTEVTY